MTRPAARDIGLVAAGGAVGAAARDAVEQLVTVQPGGLPLATLLINLGGAAVLGVLVGAAVGRRVRLLLGTGACGGFTTYSTLAVEAVQLGRHGAPAVALAYAALSALGGLAAAGAGLRIGARWT